LVSGSKSFTRAQRRRRQRAEELERHGGRRAVGHHAGRDEALQPGGAHQPLDRVVQPARSRRSGLGLGDALRDAPRLVVVLLAVVPGRLVDGKRLGEARGGAAGGVGHLSLAQQVQAFMIMIMIMMMMMMIIIIIIIIMIMIMIMLDVFAYRA
jgi:hypothetical protein